MPLHVAIAIYVDTLLASADAATLIYFFFHAYASAIRDFSIITLR